VRVVEVRCLIVPSHAKGGRVMKCPPPSARPCSITAMIVYIFERVPMEVST
jgi:hypothetical protein